MAEASRDNNGVPAALGVLNTDGVTPTRLQVNPSSHILQVSDGSTGSDFGNDIIDRDNNGVTVLAATDADGNIINLYVNSSGQLLMKST